MRLLALALIRLYQRFLSPLKGYRCAYATSRGAATCSTLGHRAIRRFGVLGGLRVLRRRFAHCAAAARTLAALRVARAAAQSGHCDLPCDASCLSSVTDAGPLAECAGCGLDLLHGAHVAGNQKGRSASPTTPGR